MPRTRDATPPTRPVPVAIEVRDLHKRFRIPTHRADTLKQRIVDRFDRSEHLELRVLEGISFDVEKGEFFGVVGRNGSGKSTLLKLLASIYRADVGRIRVAGRIAPIIELGVGFEPELNARQNVVLNGMMMGLSEKEADRSYDAVIDFAELHDFVDLKLKNYSSGMRARLAFATMTEADPDVLLLDEVLAVGDPPFQKKCEETFRRWKSDPAKTVVIVTHQMETVEKFCDRAMLLEGGRIARFGPPDEVAEDYNALLERSAPQSADAAGRPTGATKARFAQFSLEGANGAEPAALDPGEEIRIRAVVEASDEVEQPGLQLQIRNQSDGTVVFFPPAVQARDVRSLAGGERMEVDGSIENKLAPGRYSLFSVVTEIRDNEQGTVSPIASLTFEVRGGLVPDHGVVTLRHELRATVDR